MFVSVTFVSNLPSAILDAYATATNVMLVQKAYKFLNKQALGYIILQADKKIIIRYSKQGYRSALLMFPEKCIVHLDRNLYKNMKKDDAKFVTKKLRMKFL